MPDAYSSPWAPHPGDDSRGDTIASDERRTSADATIRDLHRRIRLLQLDVEWLTARSTFLRGFRSDWPAKPGEWPYWVGISAFGSVGLYCLAYLGSGYRYQWGRHAVALAVGEPAVCGLCYLLVEGRRFRRAQRKYEERRAELLAGESDWGSVADEAVGILPTNTAREVSR